MKPWRLLSLWLILIIVLAGCSGGIAPEEAGPAADLPKVVQATASPEAPTPAETAQEQESPIATPTATPAEAAPAAAPTPTVTPASGGEVATQGEEAAQLASQVLRQQLGVNFDEVKVLKVEAMQWPDSCMGLGGPAEMCMKVITPGYLVSLEANGQQYDYHVNRTLSDIRLASAPPAEVGEALITWEGMARGCERAMIGPEGVAFGPCGGPLTQGRLIEELNRPEQLAQFIQTYAPFEAETPAGKVTFAGQGSQQATPAEQRMIAEWANLVQLEAQGGRSGASWGLALAWHREGGIAGFCEDVVVYVTGIATVTSCQGNEPQELGPVRLNPEELAQLYTWIDTLQNFELEQKDSAVADAMTVRLLFSGTGTQEATPAEQQAMLDLAQTLLNRAGEQ